MRILVALVPLLVAACGSDPVSFSAPVGINMKVKSSDVASTAITEDKEITTENGNPYGAFVSDATTRLGRAPGRIEVDSATLLLGAQSTNVTRLEDVFTGVVDIAFLMNDTNNTYDAGHVTSPTGTGPVTMNHTFDWSQVAASDQSKIIGGSFKVILRGPAATDFASKGAEASLQVTFTFTAFQ